MNTALRLGATAAAFASVAMFAGLAAAQQAAAPAAPAAPTTLPTMVGPGGKMVPDLNGIWGGNLVSGGTSIVDACRTVVLQGGGGNTRNAYQGRTGAQLWITFEQDCGVNHRGKLNKPMYKPQYWQDVRLHDYYANTGGEWADYVDPDWQTVTGVPRMGAPNKIVQTANEVIFMYQAGNVFRIIPIDCSKWDPVIQYDQTAMGLANGCFLADGTLVVASTGFTDGTWLDWNGYIHSNAMTVTETFKLRVGAPPAAGGPAPVQIVYNRLVDDPTYLLQPWSIGEAVLAKQTDPAAQLLQDVPYVQRTLGNLVDPSFRG